MSNVREVHVTSYDANGDGNLSFKEAIAGIPALTQAVFDALDTNGDGYLSPDELGVDAGSDCAGCRGARSTWLGDAMTAMLGLIGLAMVAAAKKW